MAIASAELSRFLRAEDPEAGAGVELALRSDYSDDRLTVGELEALSPVLPELVAELLILCQDGYGE